MLNDLSWQIGNRGFCFFGFTGLSAIIALPSIRCWCWPRVTPLILAIEVLSISVFLSSQKRIQLLLNLLELLSEFVVALKSRLHILLHLLKHRFELRVFNKQILVELFVIGFRHRRVQPQADMLKYDPCWRIWPAKNASINADQQDVISPPHAVHVFEASFR